MIYIQMAIAVYLFVGGFLIVNAIEKGIWQRTIKSIVDRHTTPAPLIEAIFTIIFLIIWLPVTLYVFTRK